MRTRIKMCGMTRAEDAQAAAALGADSIGLVFATQSPRHVDIEQARAIAEVVPPFVARVALFLEAKADEIGRVLAAVPIDLIQFHGRERAEFCRSFGKPYLKVVPMLDVEDVAAFTARFPDAAGFVLDSHRAGGPGGTGKTFDWSRALSASSRPLLLAGGLKPENIVAAIRSVRPYAVDVSSGVESAPGIKEYAKMRDFVSEVRRADRFEDVV